MNRCMHWGAGLALAALAFALPGAAQTLRREVPADVKLAKMSVAQPPDIRLDGKPDRLSPGSRIRDTNNMGVLSASLAGKTVPVVYRRDAAGLVHEAWILSDAEYGKLAAASGAGDGAKRFTDLLALVFGARP